MNTTIKNLFWLFSLILIIGLLMNVAQAKPIAGQPHKLTCADLLCNNCNTDEDCTVGKVSISRTEGNLTEDYFVVSLLSANGPTLSLSLHYNSYNADYSHALLDSGLGYGWTHSYNIFLFSQRSYMFRSDGDGRVTRYQPGGFNPSTGFIYFSSNGYFETLKRNSNGSFTLTQKDKTTYQFAQQAGDTLLVNGPVWRLVSITDPKGNITTLTYTGGRLTTITDIYKRELKLDYNAQGHLESIKDPLEHTTTLQYDNTGRRLITITDPDGKSAHYTYNFLNQMTEELDKNGHKTTFQYRNGKPIGAVDANGNSLVQLNNPVNWATDEAALSLSMMQQYKPNTTSKIDGRGNLWKYEYDKNGYVTKITAPDGATTIITYDPVTLKVASVTDANSHTTEYKYDTNGNLIKKTDALGYITRYEYEPIFNNVIKMTDPNGRTTTYEYDNKGRRTKETDPLGYTLEWTYDDTTGNILTEKDKNGNVTCYEYDKDDYGNHSKMTQACGQPIARSTVFIYDKVGNLRSRTDANGHTTTYDYDGLNRLTVETDPVGNKTQTFYDDQGNRIKVIDRNGNATRYEYDQRNRLVKTIDALGCFTTQSYDGNNNIILGSNGFPVVTPRCSGLAISSGLWHPNDR
ncbi:MAG: hypothetical protein U1F76_27045 [Candidatus Competibacteraceae bacterium]